MSKSLKARFQRLSQLSEDYYNAPYRAALARAKRDQDDLFMMMVFAEYLGIPNPVSYYTLEMQPLLLERFHDWHVRMGMPHSPLDHIQCC